MLASHSSLLVASMLTIKAKLFLWQSCFSVSFILFVLVEVLGDGKIDEMKIFPIL